MRIGDLVLHEGQRYKVLSFDSYLGICYLMGWDLKKIEMPMDGDLKILCNPGTDWPFVALRRKSSRPMRRVLRKGVDLIPLVEWIPGDFLSSGGPIFLNPALHLSVGEVLVGIDQQRNLHRINITSSFATIKRRLDVSKRVVKIETATAYDRLLDDPFGGNEEK